MHTRVRRLRKLRDLCVSLLKAVAPGFRKKKKVLLGCVPFTQDNLREIVRSQKLQSVQQILDVYGNGRGCEVCKPALRATWSI